MEMSKEKITLKDGRYLIYFQFDKNDRESNDQDDCESEKQCCGGRK